jgi:hypothetical protein
LNHDGLIAADVFEHAELIGRERTAGFDQVDDRVGHAEGDHDFDRTAEVDQMQIRVVLFEMGFGDVRETGGDAGAGEIAHALGGTGFRDANRQPAFADAEIEARGDVDVRLGDEVAAGNSHVDRAFGTEDGDVFRAEKRDVDRQFADAGEQASLLAAIAEAGLLKEFAGDLGEAAFAGDAEAEVGHCGGARGSGRGAREEIRGFGIRDSGFGGSALRIRHSPRPAPLVPRPSCFECSFVFCRRDCDFVAFAVGGDA